MYFYANNDISIQYMTLSFHTVTISIFLWDVTPTTTTYKIKHTITVVILQIFFFPGVDYEKFLKIREH